jgi:hypothetical protein
MTQQPAGDSEDVPWVLEKTTNLILHEGRLCTTCDDFGSHYHETGTLPNNPSFQDACRANQSKACNPLLATAHGLDVLVEGSEAMAKGLNQEITEATKELGEIQRETGEVSRELKKVREEMASFRLEEPRLVDEVSGLTSHARTSHVQSVSDTNSDVAIISPPRRHMHTRTPHALFVPDSDSDVEILSPPF